MTGDNNDNPYAPPMPVEEMPILVKPEPSALYLVLYLSLMVWAIPMFLYSLLIPFPFWCVAPLGAVLIHAVTLPFVVAYIGMIFHKKWAFALCLIYSCLWVAQPFVTESPEDSPFEGLYVLIEFAIALYGVPVLVLSLILLAMTLRRKLHKHQANPSVSQGDAANSKFQTPNS